ncbi:MAG: VOC family protein [Acidobacteria bacterium]|nr:VOC family protein [Acidobacteriota bacterium]
MAAKFLNAWGYQGDAMKLPVADVDTSATFYTERMGFTIESRSEVPHKTVILARPDVRIAINENGGDPEQDGVAFQVEDVQAVFDEFRTNGLDLDPTKIKIEQREDGSEWRVFFVVAPDGLCFWIGEKVT